MHIAAFIDEQQHSKNLKPSYLSTCKWAISPFLSDQVTHTHTHIYIYIYIINSCSCPHCLRASFQASSMDAGGVGINSLHWGIQPFQDSTVL